MKARVSQTGTLPLMNSQCNKEIAWTYTAIRISTFNPQHESQRQVSIFLFCKWEKVMPCGKHCCLPTQKPFSTSSLLIEFQLDVCSAPGVNHDWPKPALAIQPSSASDWSKAEYIIQFWSGGAIPPHWIESHEKKDFFSCCPPCAFYFRCYQLRAWDTELKQPSCDHEAEDYESQPCWGRL